MPEPTPTAIAALIAGRSAYSPLSDPLLWAAVAAFLNAAAGLFLALRAHIRDQAARRENGNGATPHA